MYGMTPYGTVPYASPPATTTQDFTAPSGGAELLLLNIAKALLLAILLPFLA